MWAILEQAILIALVLGVSVAIHELGHFLYFLFKLGYSPRIEFKWKHIGIGSKADLLNLMEDERWMVFWAGIVSGVITMSILSQLLDVHLISRIALGVMYLGGCKSDLLMMLSGFDD